MRKRECAYKGMRIDPQWKSPSCDGPIAFRIRDYWRGPARKKLGPDMLLCRAHGEWYRVRSMPFTPQAEAIKEPA